VPQPLIKKFGNITKLKAWLKSPRTLESKTLDFKESVSDKDKVRKTFCSFANAGGGIIIYGVNDAKIPCGLSITGQELKDKINQILGTDVYPSTIKFEVIEEIRFLGQAKSIFVIEIFNSENTSKPHIWIKDDAVYIPIRRDGFCDYLKKHEDIRSAFLVEGEFYQSQSPDIKRILERVAILPTSSMTPLESSLITKFRLQLVQQARFTTRLKDVEEDLAWILTEHSDIQSTNNISIADIAAHQARINIFCGRINSHLSKFSKQYE
jgi:hypothetical protein